MGEPGTFLVLVSQKRKSQPQMAEGVFCPRTGQPLLEELPAWVWELLVLFATSRWWGGPRTQIGFSYLVKLESFSRRALKQGLFSGSLCQHKSISLCAVGGHSGGQGMR